MRDRTLRLLAAGVLIFVFQLVTLAQISGSIAGTVADANGAVVPSATVVVSGESGQQFTVSTNSSGGYRVPALNSGIYTVAVTAPNFKRTLIERIKVDVGTPTTVNVALQTGDVSESVTVTGSGGEVLQTQTATVGTSITGRQISETPVASRDALDLIGLLPGTATVGRPRSASINGLPKGALTITIDGVDVQDNLLRSSDGYFTYVRPRLDAIEEVNVSTANPGAESGGDGAVQVKFVTKRGTNGYSGTAFYQHRDESMNANYWYQNRDGQRDENNEAYRQKIRLNQYGASFGGPIPFFRFGDGGGSWFDSGKDKRFFFVNYEEFRLPQATARTRTVLLPSALTGDFRYLSGGVVQTVNVLTIAQAAGQLSTVDPTVAAILARIQSATQQEGTFKEISNNYNSQSYNFIPSGDSTRKFLALRLDFNLTKNHSLEFVTNQQEFVPSKDFLNGQEERYPGFPWYTQGSNRDSYSFAVRSTLSEGIINEARYAVSTGLSQFSPGISKADFDYAQGYSLAFFGTTSPVSRNSYSDRNTPTYDFTDNVTALWGNHSIGFGGQYKIVRAEGSAFGRIVPSVGFGIDSTDPAFGIFNALPSSQRASARSLYATLIGRVSSYSTTAYLSEDGTYQENGSLNRLSKQNTYGLFVQDAWRAKPNLTINFGVRWQPQTAFIALSEGNYTRLESFDQVYGLSGLGNIFKPGVLTGTAPRVVPLAKGEKAYDDDMNNFAPSVGVVWSPDFGESGFLRTLFGSSGKSVFRGGYSQAFVREGFNLLESIYGANPGGSRSLSRSVGLGNLIVGTNLRDPNNPNLAPAPGIVGSKPSFPITLGVSDSTNAFSPDLKTGVVHSFSFGYQRELDKDTVIEVRYVGNRGVDLQRQYDINEFNTIENGFADEFLKAQQNLYLNLAAGKGPTFAYFSDVAGSNQLPIMLAFFNTPANYQPSVPARYAASNFTNTGLVAALSRNAPNIFAFSGNTAFEATDARRANAVANGLPINFFYVNPSTADGGSFIVDNSNKTWYDSGVVEFRRRLSAGVRINASYVFSKAMANAYASSSVVFAGFSQRKGGIDLARNVQAFDITHQFKVDATIDLPFGSGRKFLRSSNGFVNALVGGWTVLPTIRWQSGSPFSLGNVQLVGMTAKDLQKMIGLYKNTIIDGKQVVTYLPADIIVETQKAFDIDVSTANGYGTNYGAGGPQGKYIAPAGIGNCIQRSAGQCGFNNLILYGPSFFKLDATLVKRFRLGERRSFEFRITALDALNAPNFRIGGWGADVVTAGVGGDTFGQLGPGSAYQDVSTTNDNGGRQIDLMLRITF